MPLASLVCIWRLCSVLSILVLTGAAPALSPWLTPGAHFAYVGTRVDTLAVRYDCSISPRPCGYRRSYGVVDDQSVSAEGTDLVRRDHLAFAAADAYPESLATEDRRRVERLLSSPVPALGIVGESVRIEYGVPARPRRSIIAETDYADPRVIVAFGAPAGAVWHNEPASRTRRRVQTGGVDPGDLASPVIEEDSTLTIVPGGAVHIDALRDFRIVSSLDQTAFGASYASDHAMDGSPRSVSVGATVGPQGHRRLPTTIGGQDGTVPAPVLVRDWYPGGSALPLPSDEGSYVGRRALSRECIGPGGSASAEAFVFSVHRRIVAAAAGLVSDDDLLLHVDDRRVVSCSIETKRDRAYDPGSGALVSEKTERTMLRSSPAASPASRS